ncbi:unknown protein [Grouper iridovirus]|uniref:Rho termination factor-like N-terminal domain-containing protein n=1 Tax=Grouper iridovirus TaxID=127569 RepID=Q5GAL5_9VIRU|nr:unknown protein [Grouper iridovirus]
MVTVKELQAQAKALGIRGYSSMRKAELEDAIKQHQAGVSKQKKSPDKRPDSLRKSASPERSRDKSPRSPRSPRRPRDSPERSRDKRPASPRRPRDSPERSRDKRPASPRRPRDSPERSRDKRPASPRRPRDSPERSRDKRPASPRRPRGSLVSPDSEIQRPVTMPACMRLNKAQILIVASRLGINDIRADGKPKTKQDLCNDILNFNTRVRSPPVSRAHSPSPAVPPLGRSVTFPTSMSACTNLKREQLMTLAARLNIDALKSDGKAKTKSILCEEIMAMKYAMDDISDKTMLELAEQMDDMELDELSAEDELALQMEDLGLDRVDRTAVASPSRASMDERVRELTAKISGLSIKPTAMDFAKYGAKPKIRQTPKEVEERLGAKPKIRQTPKEVEERLARKMRKAERDRDREWQPAESPVAEPKPARARPPGAETMKNVMDELYTDAANYEKQKRLHGEDTSELIRRALESQSEKMHQEYLEKERIRKLCDAEREQAERVKQDAMWAEEVRARDQIIKDMEAAANVAAEKRKAGLRDQTQVLDGIARAAQVVQAERYRETATPWEAETRARSQRLAEIEAEADVKSSEEERRKREERNERERRRLEMEAEARAEQNEQIRSEERAERARILEERRRQEALNNARAEDALRKRQQEYADQQRALEEHRLNEDFAILAAAKAGQKAKSVITEDPITRAEKQERERIMAELEANALTKQMQKQLQLETAARAQTRAEEMRQAREATLMNEAAAFPDAAESAWEIKALELKEKREQERANIVKMNIAKLERKRDAVGSPPSAEQLAKELEEKRIRHAEAQKLQEKTAAAEKYRIERMKGNDAAKEAADKFFKTRAERIAHAVRDPTGKEGEWEKRRERMRNLTKLRDERRKVLHDLAEAQPVKRKQPEPPVAEGARMQKTSPLTAPELAQEEDRMFDPNLVSEPAQWDAQDSAVYQNLTKWDDSQYVRALDEWPDNVSPDEADAILREFRTVVADDADLNNVKKSILSALGF